MRWAVIDCESIHLADAVGGWNNVHKMGVASCVLYDVKRNRTIIYGQQDVEKLRKDLEKYDRVTTYNGDRFDFPLIYARENRQMPREMLGKSDDVFKRILLAQGLNPDWVGAHKGFGLDAVCRALLRRGKIDVGTHAPQLFAEEKYGELHTYNADDVMLTYELAKFIDEYGFCLHPKEEKAIWVDKWQPIPVRAAA